MGWPGKNLESEGSEQPEMTHAAALGKANGKYYMCLGQRIGVCI